MSNRFDLLFLDEDGAPAAPVTNKKSTPVTAAKKAEPVKTAPASVPSKGRMDGDRKGKEASGQHQGRSKPTDVIQDATELPDRPNRGAARRGGRQAASNQPARNYDRHSRMGHKEGGEKRQYAGKGNWGNPADPAEAVTEAIESGTLPAVLTEGTEVVEVHEPTAAAASTFMTLEQFLAEQEKKKPTVSAPKARSANDGAKVAGEVVKKADDMYFQTAKPVANGKAAKTAAAAASAKATGTKFSLQELNKAIPGGLARPPRPVREESQPQRGGKGTGRRFENNAEKPSSAAAHPAAKAANIKDSSAFPSL